MGGKLIILDKILRICKEKSDKLLVFSQSLFSLTLIEKYLELQHLTRTEKWVLGQDYFRLDGSTEMQRRKDTVDKFNDPDNPRARLFLISTKAGGIGINLVGANRCVIFDACWNPSHDTQSIFRIYRFGQVKNVYVYRFLAQGTMEEKIYQRQVTKQGLSQRVIDEHQLDRHFTSQELRELYAFEPDTLDEKRPMPPMPSDDDLLKSVIFDCRKWLVKYHEHDSLLENKINEGLSEAERKAAWDEYEKEKSLQETSRNFLNAVNSFSGVFQPDVSILF
jgi:transcriptional regulator ATRX